MEKGRVYFVIFMILLVIGIFFIFGYYGNNEAQKIGAHCDIGLGDSFCWKWTQEVVFSGG